MVRTLVAAFGGGALGWLAGFAFIVAFGGGLPENAPFVMLISICAGAICGAIAGGVDVIETAIRESYDDPDEDYNDDDEDEEDDSGARS